MAENTLNSKPLRSVFGIMIERHGLNNFLAFPKRKESLKKDWQDEDGQQIDLSEPRFEARRFSLDCILTAEADSVQATRDRFWELYNGLFTEISALGTHQIYLASIDKEFTVFYVDQTNVSKIGYDGKKMVIRFTLVFEETDPYVNIPKVYLTDDQGNFLIA